VVEPCQRWRERRERYRPAGERIDPSRYGVEILPDDRRAKAFVVAHHYSGTFPAARVRVGLFRMRELVGVAVFSVPQQRAALPRWTGTTEVDGVELGRFVLLDDVPGNGESWFLARAFRALRAERPTVRAVLSYSDPLPRHAHDGRVVTPGHVGVIYQAHNGRHLGRAEAREIVVDRDGRTVGRRGLSKLRRGERSGGGTYRQLLAAGAPDRRVGEDWSAWVDRVLVAGPFRKVRHPGNLVYAWDLDGTAVLPEALPYPRRV
jgi:hypothetical protein